MISYCHPADPNVSSAYELGKAFEYMSQRRDYEYEGLAIVEE